MMTY